MCPLQRPITSNGVAHGSEIADRRVHQVVNCTASKPSITKTSSHSIHVTQNSTAVSLPQMTSENEFTISLPSEQSATRALWIVARPLNSTLPKNRSPKFARAGWGTLRGPILFATMHWGLLVTDRDFAGVSSSLHHSSLDPKTEGHEELGVMYQLRRGEGNQNTLENIADFGTRHLQDEWQIRTLHYVGLTDFSDDRIEARGTLTYQ